jgi:hypothetical protein
MKDIPMAGSYIDDGLCSAMSDDDHLKTLQKIFQRMRESNYFLSKDKCVFMKPSIQYLGHVISKNGIHTSPSKVEAIQCIQRPTSVTETRTFLGLVNFYCKFVPFLSDSFDPLYELTRADVPWKWSNKCQTAFEEVKSKLSSTQVLAHFNPKLQIGISCDASAIGIGVVLFHIFPDSSERPSPTHPKRCHRQNEDIHKSRRKVFPLCMALRNSISICVVADSHLSRTTDHFLPYSGQRVNSSRM